METCAVSAVGGQWNTTALLHTQGELLLSAICYS